MNGYLLVVRGTKPKLFLASVVTPRITAIRDFAIVIGNLAAATRIAVEFNSTIQAKTLGRVYACPLSKS